jgi:hypothetical protein
MTETDSHKIHIDASHGEVSSLYRGICSCGWISGDSKGSDEPKDEAQRHLEGRPMRYRNLPIEAPIPR